MNMLNKEQIVELLMNEFRSVYCDTCRGNDVDDSCEYCHRKYMEWSISKDSAQRIAEKIVKGESNE